MDGAVDDNPRMLARFAAFFVWALVAATAVFWGLRLTVRSPSAPTYTVAVADSGALRGDLGRLLGATPVASATAPVAAAPQLASRFKLLGLMAGREPTAPGLALLAIDSKPARPYAVGSTIEEGLVLQSVSLRSAAIGPAEGSPALTLEIPPLPAPATGKLPSPSAAAPVVAPAAPPPRPASLPVPRPAAAAAVAVPGQPPAVGRPRMPGQTVR